MITLLPKRSPKGNFPINRRILVSVPKTFSNNLILFNGLFKARFYLRFLRLLQKLYNIGKIIKWKFKIFFSTCLIGNVRKILGTSLLQRSPLPRLYSQETKIDGQIGFVKYLRMVCRPIEIARDYILSSYCIFIHVPERISYIF